MFSETVAISPTAPETVRINPGPAPPRPPAGDETQDVGISDLPTWRVRDPAAGGLPTRQFPDAPVNNAPTRRFADAPVNDLPTQQFTGGPGGASVFDQPTAYVPPAGRPTGQPNSQVTLYPVTSPRPAPMPEPAPAPPPTSARGSTRPVPGEVLRFGPGVPSRAETDMSRIAGFWHGEQEPEPRAQKPSRGRRLARWILPAAVLLAVVAVLLWRYASTPIAVTGVSARAGQQTLGCNGTETVTGVIDTNGEGGTVTYEWQRSDGTVSGTLQQHVSKGTHSSDVTLLWTFNGKGAAHATATLEVLSPGSRTASADFTYSCKQ